MQEDIDEEQGLTKRDIEYELEERERKRGILGRINWSLVFLILFTLGVFAAFFVPLLLPYKNNHNIYLIQTNTTGSDLNAIIQHAHYSNLVVESELASYSVSLNNRSSDSFNFSAYTRDSDLKYDTLYTVWSSSTQKNSAIIETNMKSNTSSLYGLVAIDIRNIFTSSGGLYAIGVPSGLYNISTSTAQVVQMFDPTITLAHGGGKGKNPFSYYFTYYNGSVQNQYIALIDASANSTTNHTVKLQFSLTNYTSENKTVLDFTYLIDSDTFVILLQENYGDRVLSIVNLDKNGRFKQAQSIPDTPAQYYQSWPQFQKGIGYEYVVCVQRNWSWHFTGVACYRYDAARNELEGIASSDNVPNGHIMYIGE